MAAPVYVNHGTGVTTGTSITVTKPSSTADGHLMLVHIQHSTGNLGADGTAPSGWTLIGSRQENASSSHWYYWKIASSEGASWDWTNYASATLQYGIVIVSGADQTTPLNVTHLLQNTNIGGTTVALSVITAVADCLLVGFAGQDQTVTTNTWSQASMTERYDESQTADLTHCGYTETVTTATTYNRTITASVAQRISGALIGVAPASSTTVTGVAAAAFGFTATAAGVDRALGSAAGLFGFTATASGIAGAPPVTGQAVAAFGFTATASGVPRTPGQATASFGFTATAAGVDRAIGAAVVAFGFTATSAGVDRALGAAVATFGYTATAAGVPDVHGVAAGVFGFTGTASGFAGTPPVTGAASAVFGFTSTANGQPRTPGQASATFGYTATAAGYPRVVAAAATSFGFAGTATGLRTALGVAQALLGFTATANGQGATVKAQSLATVTAVRSGLATATARQTSTASATSSAHSEPTIN